MSADEFRRKVKSGELPPVVMTPPETDPTKTVTMVYGVDYALDDAPPSPDLIIEKP